MVKVIAEMLDHLAPQTIRGIAVSILNAEAWWDGDEDEPSSELKVLARVLVQYLRHEHSDSYSETEIAEWFAGDACVADY